MTSEQIALLADTRLSEGARVLGLVITVYQLHQRDADGWTEIPKQDLAGVLTTASDSTLRRLRSELERTRWLEWKQGGRGHHNRYRIIPHHECGPIARLRVAFEHTLLDKVGTTDALSPEYPATGGALSAPVVVGEEGVVGEGGETRAPPREPDPLEERVETIVAALPPECHDPLRFYLQERVPPDRHHGYASTLQGWFQGLDAAVFRLPDGSTVENGSRARVVANALSELRGGAERKMKRAVGDPANLKTKINVLLKQENDDGSHRRHDLNEGRSEAARGKARRSGIGSGQGTFRIEGLDD